MREILEDMSTFDPITDVAGQNPINCTIGTCIGNWDEMIELFVKLNKALITENLRIGGNIAVSAFTFLFFPKTAFDKYRT